MKDNAFIQGMRKAGKLAALTLEHTCSFAKEGVTTDELDKIAHDFTLSNGGTNACLGYRGYPKSICTSINEVLCHGLPDSTKLQSGDIVNIDVTVKVGPYHGDTSRTIAIGTVSEEARDIIRAAKGARDAGITAIRPRGRTGDIGYSTQVWIQNNFSQFKLVKDIGGHGIGKIFHDKPFVPAFGSFGFGEVLRPWTCITVEPIVWQGEFQEQLPIEPLAGMEKCAVTVIKANRGLSAQFEHTVLITHLGYEILTELS